MSFVGPRPEVQRYVELFREDYAEILKVLPGITDLGSLQFRNEPELLGRSKEPEE
jgi:lipopolysaccharide/colanic/teichoic acid biosynthesis glycosyltransferase